jgi:hypothetical protein
LDTDGLDADDELNAGLLFISYQNDPQHFIRLQNRLGAHDLLNEYIRHIGSAIFAIPPAPEEGRYIGQPRTSQVRRWQCGPDAEGDPHGRHFDGQGGASSARDVRAALESVECVDALGEYPSGPGSGVDTASTRCGAGRRLARRQPGAVPQTCS